MTYKPFTPDVVAHELLEELKRELKKMNDHFALVTGTADPPDESK